MNKQMRPKTYLLAKAIQERKDILFGNNDAVFKPNALKEKEEAWEAIRAEMIDNGFPNFERKSWKDVRNHDWQYLRRSAVSKFEHNQKPGNEPIQYNEVDRLVFDIMGNDSTAFNDSNSDGGGNSNNISSPAFDFFNGSFDLMGDAMNKSFTDGGVQDATTMENILAVARSMPSTSAAPSFNGNGGLNTLIDQQQQLNSIFNSVVNRKASWDTDSSTESNKETRRLGNGQSDALSEYSKFLNGGSGGAHLDILSGLNMNGLGPLDNKTVFTNQNPRKRPHSTSEKPIDEKIQEAKLQLLLIQVKREEALLEQERAKVIQEQAKARQEQAKAQLLERELEEANKTRTFANSVDASDSAKD
ncbi:hypothetical protein Ddc_09131 [Ditylenchus destructor]|nr:hypothetical protein Ddc_09131 [Ditylenchus destructor]